MYNVKWVTGPQGIIAQICSSPWGLLVHKLGSHQPHFQQQKALIKHDKQSQQRADEHGETFSS